MHSVNMLPDSNNHLEVILQRSFDIFLKVKFASRWEVDLHKMHGQVMDANLNI